MFGKSGFVLIFGKGVVACGCDLGVNAGMRVMLGSNQIQRKHTHCIIRSRILTGYFELA